MGIDGIGSSAIIALAAVLWFVYLIPTWLRRREYLSTERNAVRLQQTVRIMAESAEIPDVVRVEANARAVAAQRAALRMQERLASRTQMSRSVGSVASAPQRQGAVSMDSGSTAHSIVRAQRLRRSRMFASLVLLAAIVAAGFGSYFLMATGSWVLLAASGAVGFGAFALLGQLAAVGRANRDLVRATRVAPVAEELRAHAVAQTDERPTAWTPVPLPKPLYLSHPIPARPLSRLDDPQVDLGETLRRAAAASEQALRAAQAAPEVARIAPPPSKFAAMGIVDEQDVVPTDLDDILRRRRLAG